MSKVGLPLELIFSALGPHAIYVLIKRAYEFKICEESFVMRLVLPICLDLSPLGSADLEQLPLLISQLSLCPLERRDVDVIEREEGHVVVPAERAACN